MERHHASLVLLSAIVLGCGGSPDAEGEPSPEPATPAPSAGEAAEPSAAASTPSSPTAIVQARADGFDVTAEVTVPEGMESEAVPFTAEPLNLTMGAIPERVDEADAFGTGLAIDLDGDGATDDVLAVSCDDGRLTLGETTLSPLAPEDSTRMHFADAAQPLGEGGAWAIQYDRCDADHPITLGLSREPIDLFHTRGPALAITLMEPPGRGQAQFQQVFLDGESITARVWTSRQATLEDDGDVRWANLAGFHVPIPADGEEHTVEVGVAADDPLWPRVIMTETRWAPEPEVRARTERELVETRP